MGCKQPLASTGWPMYNGKMSGRLAHVQWKMSLNMLHYGYDAHGYRYEIRKPDPQYTHGKLYLLWLHLYSDIWFHVSLIYVITVVILDGWLVTPMSIFVYVWSNPYTHHSDIRWVIGHFNHFNVGWCVSLIHALTITIWNGSLAALIIPIFWYWFLC